MLRLISPIQMNACEDALLTEAQARGLSLSAFTRRPELTLSWFFQGIHPGVER
jgi:hypothetical protein